MQNTNNDNKHRYKLIRLSILILECDFRFDLNLELNSLVQSLVPRQTCAEIICLHVACVASFPIPAKRNIRPREGVFLFGTHRKWSDKFVALFSTRPSLCPILLSACTGTGTLATWANLRADLRALGSFIHANGR